MKICQIYKMAAHYRKRIFTLMDREFDSDYVFGTSIEDIKQMDTSGFRGKVTKVRNRFLYKGFYWQPNVQRLLNKGYDAFIITGDTRCLSTWLFCIRAKLLGYSEHIFFWTHGWYGKENHIERLLKKIFFRLAGGGIFLYGNYARMLMIQEGFDANKLYVIHNSLDYDQQLSVRKKLHKEEVFLQHFGNDMLNLIFVGRLTKVKKLHMVLQAMALLKERGKIYNLTLIGEGQELPNLEMEAKKLSIEKNVWFYGACYDEDKLAQLIYNADLCVSPGNVGLTAMHVMVFGTPVLTHNDFPHQMPEFEAIHNGKTGAFFHNDDVFSLADAVERWFEINNKNRELVRKACYNEIDTHWTPQFQIQILKSILQK